MTLRHIVAACLLLSGFPAAIAATAACEPASTGDVLQVVVLHPGDAYLPANITAEGAMREALTRHVARAVTFHRETLGGLENLAIEDAPAKIAALRTAYPRADLVMPITGTAVDFIRQYGASLWPQTPVVYVGVGEGTIDVKALPERFSGVSMPVDLPGTVELAFRLRPHPVKVIYITGASAYDAWWTPVFRAAMQRHKTVPVEEWIGRPLRQLQSGLANLPTDAIVVYASMFRDEEGTRYVPGEVAVPLATASRAPIFGPLSSYIGTGIVGGSVVDLAGHGREAGELAANILNARRAAMTVSPTHLVSALHCRVDARQLQRWHLPAAQLPDDCEVTFVTPSFWQRHRMAIVVGAVVALLLLALYVQSRRRQRMEMEVRRRSAENASAARLALIGQITASVTHEVTQPLSAILANADAAGMMLATPNPSIEEMRQIIDDIRSDNRRACEIVQRVSMLLKDRKVQKELLDLNEIVGGVIALMRPDALRRGLVVSQTLDLDLPPIEGDPVHLQQVLLNLIINAADAMERLPPGERRVEVKTTRHDAGHAMVCVSDMGSGIDAAQLPKLFDSFFTTKAHGTGLGLSIARVIVEAHGGVIRAYNNKAAGATVSFTLPLS